MFPSIFVIRFFSIDYCHSVRKKRYVTRYRSVVERRTVGLGGARDDIEHFSGGRAQRRHNSGVAPGQERAHAHELRQRIRKTSSARTAIAYVVCKYRLDGDL